MRPVDSRRLSLVVLVGEMEQILGGLTVSGNRNEFLAICPGDQWISASVMLVFLKSKGECQEGASHILPGRRGSGMMATTVLLFR